MFFYVVGHGRTEASRTGDQGSTEHKSTAETPGADAEAGRGATQVSGSRLLIYYLICQSYLGCYEKAQYY